MSRKVQILFLTLIFVPFLSFSQALSTPAGNVEIISSTEYFNKVHSLINEASKSILVAMYTFEYYPEYSDSPSNILMQDLIKAKKRGANVEVLLDISDFNKEITKENQNTGRILSRNGVKVHYDKIDVTTHAKAIVIDSKYTVIGSHNWTYYGLSKNNEISILIDSEGLAKEVEKYIMQLIRENK
jgi:phosphatidylserine/phosphatidylglycerophosphate/cardiolipin synthase-like enzyme